ncbi:MAG TPA: hypothetical protein VGN07_05975, partial [Steroidobacteraceae bacterium]
SSTIATLTVIYRSSKAAALPAKPWGIVCARKFFSSSSLRLQSTSRNLRERTAHAAAGNYSVVISGVAFQRSRLADACRVPSKTTYSGEA